MTDLPLQRMQKAASGKFDINDIDSHFIANFIYNSLSFKTDLKGLEEVEHILNGKHEGISDETVTLVLNHLNGFNFIVDLVKNEKDFNENTLKDLHNVLLGGTENGGLYRNVDISIRGSNHTPPSHIKVYDRMKKYFDTLDNFEGCPFEKIAFSYVQLAKIHPFFLGNGRTARLVLNFHLMKAKLVPIIIPHSDKVNYFHCLEEFKVNKNIKPFKKYIKNIEEKTLGFEESDCK
jgi:Fic family protein